MSRDVNDDDDDSLGFPGERKPRRKRASREKVGGKVKAPAIGLIVVGSLGLIVSILNVVIAISAKPVVPDPTAPEFVQALQRGQVGPIAVGIQSLFLVLNVIIILGAVQMLQFNARPFAIAVSILAMMNFGSCCCVLGLPIGIWSLVVLLSDDVARAFNATSS